MLAGMAMGLLIGGIALANANQEILAVKTSPKDDVATRPGQELHEEEANLQEGRLGHSCQGCFGPRIVC